MLFAQENMMRLRVARIIGKFEGGESGIVFPETLAALAPLGIIVVAFLSGLATAHHHLAGIEPISLIGADIEAK